MKATKIYQLYYYVRSTYTFVASENKRDTPL